MEDFEESSRINDLLTFGRESDARNSLIRLLARYKRDGVPFEELTNSLIRQTGLFPYIQVENAGWQERFVASAFSTEIGSGKVAILHREQSSILKKLLEGKDVAVSAPTSFGKSFIVDSYIATRRPGNVMIIVPTIALADETRRRLQSKFSDEYLIITTPEVKLAEKNIFVFPQERALGYVDKIDKLDILIVDEFYKAGIAFDKDRSSALLRAIMKLSEKSRQRYFLAPNISSLRANPFTEGMEFLRLDFNTVVLNEVSLFSEIGNDLARKSSALTSILEKASGKSLIYAGTYSNIKKVAEVVLQISGFELPKKLTSFSIWLEEHYCKDWVFSDLIRHGVGVHNGQLRRSLSQLQIKLFEEDDGLNTLISTSSIVEGVNTSAENVILWSNKNGGAKLDYFTYRNIVGRSGRMFRHFVGNVFILEKPPEVTTSELSLGFSDDLLSEIDEEEYRASLTPDEVAKIISYRKEMSGLMGKDVFSSLQKENAFLTNDYHLLKKICSDIKADPNFWAGIGYLNSNNPEQWDRILYKIINIRRSGWNVKFERLVAFTKILSKNWHCPIPKLLDMLRPYEIDIELFFQLERLVSYRLSALLNDVNVIHRRMAKGAVDISPFVAKLSHAFLPSSVYQLEEYGLPRMLSKRLQSTGIIDFESEGATLTDVLARLKSLGVEFIRSKIAMPGTFDEYILEYFFDGIGASQRS